MTNKPSQDNNSSQIITVNEDVALKLFLNARGFYLAARILDCHQGNKSLLLWPTVANETFALELYLKCLHKIRGKDLWGHDTKKLFDSLSVDDQIKVDRYLLEIIQQHPSYLEMSQRGVRMDADSVVQRARTAFEKSRYWWEGELPSADNDGFVTNAGVGNMCDAIRKLIVDSNPTWVDCERSMRITLPAPWKLPS